MKLLGSAVFSVKILLLLIIVPLPAVCLMNILILLLFLALCIAGHEKKKKDTLLKINPSMFECLCHRFGRGYFECLCYWKLSFTLS